MEIEQLDLEVKTYNRLKKAGISTTDDLVEALYSREPKISAPDAKKCEAALKDAGIIKYMRGDYVTEEDVEPEPLTWDELHNYIGKLVVFDCSTESHKWLKVNWIFDIKDDGEGTVICSDGSRDYSYIRRNTVNGGYYQRHDPEYLSRHEQLKTAGRMFALKSEEVKTVSETQVMSADYTKAVTLTKRIKANAASAQESLWEVCKGLNEVRNGQLYKELGYQNFDRYCKGEIGLTPQQGRKYAAIASLVKLENGKSTFSFETIGTEKLYLLAKLDEPQREEIRQTTDLENTSVKELKKKIADLEKNKSKLIDDLKNACEERDKERGYREELVVENGQMSDRISELLADNDEAKDTIQSLEQQIEELEERPIDVAVQTLPDDEEIEKLTAQFKEDLAKHEKDTERQLEELRQHYRKELKDQRDRFTKAAEQENTDEEKEIAEKAELECTIKFATDALRRLTRYVMSIDSEDKAYARYAIKTVDEVYDILKNFEAEKRD